MKIPTARVTQHPLFDERPLQARFENLVRDLILPATLGQPVATRLDLRESRTESREVARRRDRIQVPRRGIGDVLPIGGGEQLPAPRARLRSDLLDELWVPPAKAGEESS